MLLLLTSMTPADGLPAKKVLGNQGETWLCYVWALEGLLGACFIQFCHAQSSTDG